jgi:hypothetical protein
MLVSFLAALGRPDWWSIALAGFLARGGILLVLLPIITVPSPAELATALSPTVSELAFGGLTPLVLGGIVAVSVAALAILAASGLAGAWLDRELLRAAALDDELELGWVPAQTSLREALSVRLAAHLPTLAALAYATFRLIGATYDELLAPGDAATPIILRIVSRAPDAIALVLAAWLVGEAVGGLADRHLAAGSGFLEALRNATRQLLSRRGLGTSALTTVALVAVIAPFLLAVTRAWQQLRDVLLGATDPLLVVAALLVLVASWILGLAVIGAALAWRATAWTAELRPGAGRPPSVAPMHREAAEI